MLFWPEINVKGKVFWLSGLGYIQYVISALEQNICDPLPKIGHVREEHNAPIKPFLLSIEA